MFNSLTETECKVWKHVDMAQNSLMANAKKVKNTSKKRKTDSGASGVEKRRAIGTSPFKATRARFIRRVSSRNSEPGPQSSSSSRTPILHLPRKDPRPPSHTSHPASGSTRNRTPLVTDTQLSQARNSDRVAKEAAVGSDNNEQEGDEEDEEDEEEEEEMVIGGIMKEGLTKHMRRLTKAERHVALGKAFTLKYWPWPSYNWWVDNDDVGGLGEGTSQCELDAERSFSFYLNATLIEESEWMTSSFRSSVTIPVHIPEPNLTTP